MTHSPMTDDPHEIELELDEGVIEQLEQDHVDANALLNALTRRHMAAEDGDVEAYVSACREVEAATEGSGDD